MATSQLKPKIGIVSGIGPLAGADVLHKVFKHAAFVYSAVEDNEYPDVALLNHGIDGVGNSGSLNDDFQSGIITMVHDLESLGATIIGIACNTAHVYIHKIRVMKSTILVNLIDAVASEAAKHDNQYLLLTSSVSKQQKLYQPYLHKHGVQFTETTDGIQKKLDSAIALVMAHKLNEAGQLLNSVIDWAAAHGCTAIIAGCTELPIAIGHCQNVGLDVIDSNEVLAAHLTSHYYEGVSTVQ